MGSGPDEEGLVGSLNAVIGVPIIVDWSIRSVIDNDVLPSTTRGNICLVEGRYMIGVGRCELEAMRR